MQTTLEERSAYLEEVHSRKHRFIYAVVPTWRDLWAILRGRYTPFLRILTEHRENSEKELDEAVQILFEGPDPIPTRVKLYNIAGSMPLPSEDRIAIAINAEKRRKSETEHPAIRALRSDRGEAFSPNKIVIAGNKGETHPYS